jgi:carbon-monoxide dehydrogenase large subunit
MNKPLPAEQLATRHIGQPLTRREDQRLLRGQGRYVDDLHPAGLLHAAVLRSNFAHARIVSLDVTRARALPGVHDIITAAEVAQCCGGRVPRTPLRLASMPELVPYEQPVIADGTVRFVGEPIALVVADSVAIAEDALELIDVEVEDLQPIADTATALADEVRLFDGQSNCPVCYLATKGEVRPGADDVVITERLSVQRHSAVTMEGRGVLAAWDAQARRMVMHGAAKIPFNTRKLIAQGLGLAEDQVDAIECDVGGGFGVRGEFYPEDLLVPVAAMRSGRPVKWVEDRRENLLSSNHAREMSATLELRCSPEGRILSLTGTVHVDVGAYLRTTAAIPVRNVAQAIVGPYRFPAVHMESMAIVTNKTPIGTYRAPGRFEADFFRERLFDIAARRLGLDSVAFRRLNLVTQHELPYSMPTLTPVEKTDELDNGDYGATLDRCLGEIGWDALQPLQGQLLDGKYHGIAVSCFVEGGAAGPKELACLRVDPRGRICVVVGSANVGQGVETVSLQIAADALDMPMEALDIEHGSTTLLSEGYGSFHSRSTVMGGAAILDAARALKTKLRALAAARMGCAPEQVVLEPGLQARFGSQTLGLAQLCGEGLRADGVYAAHHHTYSYGAAAAHVTVDAETGMVEVLDYITIEDMGVVVNPLTAAGQIVGGTMQGLGGALLEEFVYDDQAQLLTGSLADYLLPSATDFPCVRGIAIGEHPSTTNPLGAKGGGEGGTVPVGGVIANAVAAALASLDVRPTQLPLSPFNVWKLMRDKRHA